MKSAYEIAMAKLEKESGPIRKLTEEQKARSGEIDKIYEAKIAQVHLKFDDKLAGAVPPPQAEIILQEKSREIQEIETKREQEKDALWNES